MIDLLRAQLGISRMARQATDVTMHAESSILELVATADGVAIAAPVREIADSSCGTHLRSVAVPSCILHGLTCTRSQHGARQLWPVRLSPTRPQEVIDFEELLSELITMARMLPIHLGSRLVSALVTYGVRWRTLSCEERCGRMNANPVKSTCTSTTPLLSERAGGDACL